MSNKQQFNQDDGAVLLLMAGLLVVLLLIVGLAVDSGNLYRAQIALQNAADAASLAGIGYTTTKGKFELDRLVIDSEGHWSSRTERDKKVEKFLKVKTDEVAFSVLNRENFPNEPPGPRGVPSKYAVKTSVVFNSPDPAIVTDRVYDYTVTVSRQIDFLLLDLIPAFADGGSLGLSATATAQRKVGNIVILLDVSDSMNCPATGSCDCMLTSGAAACAGTTKIDALVEAVKVFMKLFDIQRDKLYVTPFNVRSQVFSLQDYLSRNPILGNLEDLDETKIDQVVNLVRTQHNPKGSTNICDGLMRTIDKLKEDQIWGNEDVSYVLFTDGAPTAGRFLFADPKPALQPWSPRTGAGGGVFDYSLYSVKWALPTTPPTQFIGPSILLQTDLLLMSHSSAQPPAAGSGRTDEDQPSAAGWAQCSINTLSDPLNPVNSQADQAISANQVFGPCLESMASHMPELPGKVYGSNYGKAGVTDFSQWREMNFNCAIQLTDLMRDNRGTVNVIGLGTPIPFTADSSGKLTDPYQGAGEVAGRHDAFNARLAADEIRAVLNPLFLPPNVTKQPYPEWDYQGYQTYTAIGQKKKVGGTYLASPTGNDLKKLFEQIGNEILLRLSK